MSNYSYRRLSGCGKQLGSHLVLQHKAMHPRPIKDGDRALATQDKKFHVVKLVVNVLYTSSIKHHSLKIDFIVSGKTLQFQLAIHTL